MSYIDFDREEVCSSEVECPGTTVCYHSSAISSLQPHLESTIEKNLSNSKITELLYNYESELKAARWPE
jgi:hypothetical protein